jgi:hypothetical protein
MPRFVIQGDGGYGELVVNVIDKKMSATDSLLDNNENRSNLLRKRICINNK